MAKVNKPNAIKQSAGLPTLEAISTHQQGDTVPAVVNSPEGQQPAALTEGEFVFAIPAIIAIGEGDYEKGAQMLQQIHQQLMQMGEKMMNGGGIEGTME